MNALTTRIGPAFAAATLLLATTACGGGDDAGSPDSVVDVVNGEKTASCPMMSTKDVEKISGTDKLETDKGSVGDLGDCSWRTSDTDEQVVSVVLFKSWPDSAEMPATCTGIEEDAVTIDDAGHLACYVPAGVLGPVPQVAVEIEEFGRWAIVSLPEDASDKEGLATDYAQAVAKATKKMKYDAPEVTEWQRAMRNPCTLIEGPEIADLLRAPVVKSVVRSGTCTLLGENDMPLASANALGEDEVNPCTEEGNNVADLAVGEGSCVTTWYPPQFDVQVGEYVADLSLELDQSNTTEEAAIAAAKPLVEKMAELVASRIEG